MNRNSMELHSKAKPIVQELAYIRLANKDYIRLLELDPGTGDESLSCKLTPVPLSEAIEYEALSYVWGDPKERREITCSESRLEITINLHLALLHLRYQDRCRILWVDAICINQEDLNERVQQVTAMGDIYAKAQGVLVWLGPKLELDYKAFDTMSLLRSRFPDLTQERLRLENFDTHGGLDVFKGFAITNMVDNKDLRLLSCASGFAQFSKHELPSWVPDWSTSVDRDPTAAYSSSFHAGGHSQPRISIRSTGDDVLVIHGKLISQVTKIAISRFSAAESMNGISGEDDPMGMLNKVFQWCKGQLEWLKEWHGLQLGDGASQALEFLDGPLEMDFLRSLLCDGHVYEEFASVDFPERYKNIHRTCSDYVEMLTKFSEGETEISEQDSEFLGLFPKTWEKFSAQVSFSAYGRSFCRTANGYVGYVPNETEPGDVVCLFYGATVLYVMRPDGDGTYRLVGEWCMEGLMHGEALEATQFESQDFHIR